MYHIFVVCIYAVLLLRPLFVTWAAAC